MKNDILYAYPFEINKNSETVHFGMTLRDYFAAQCLTMQVSFSGDQGHAEAVAKQAYKYADAMLKARDAK